MAEVNQYTFSYQEIVEMLLKRADIHEGLWTLSIQFSMQASNFGSAPSALAPTALISVQWIGIQRIPAGMPSENNLTIDAAKVNPAPKPPKRK